jgi:DNA-binding transcriptional ArsR family regulator
MKIESLVKDITKKYEALANPVRIHILSIIIALGEATWSEIKAIFESIHGKTNPNTLAFHIKKLVDCGLILKSGSPESPTYTANIPEELRCELGEVIKFYKELVEGKR